MLPPAHRHDQILRTIPVDHCETSGTRIRTCTTGCLSRARSLLADCHYRIALIWKEKRQWKKAAAEYDIYLSRRKDGWGSIYPIRNVKASYAKVLTKVRRKTAAIPESSQTRK
jgi:hypothetical protein